MNTRIKLILAVMLWPLLSIVCLAQDAASAPVSIALPADAQNFVLVLLGNLMVSHPWIATLVAVIGSMRVWAKPLFSAVHAVIEVTPSKYDDGLWNIAYRFFTENPVGKVIAWLLDYVGSVKIAPPAKPAEKPEV